MCVCVPQGDWVLCRVFFKSRSEISGKREAEEDATALSPPSLPALMQPSPPYITFEQSQEEACASGHHHQYHEQQVPCFSIFSPKPTSMPNNYGAAKPSNLGFYDSSSATMRAVLNHLTKMENQPNNNNLMMVIKGGGSEGSSDCSYLSDVPAGGLSSVWNHYS